MTSEQGGYTLETAPYTTMPDSGTLSVDLFGNEDRPNGKLTGVVNGNFKVSVTGDDFETGYVVNIYLSRSVDRTSVDLGLYALKVVFDDTIFEEAPELAAAGCNFSGCDDTQLTDGLHTIGNLPLKG